MGELDKKLIAILQAAVANKASDVHLMTGQAPALRQGAGLTPLAHPAFTAEEMHAIVLQVMLTTPEQKAQLQSLQDLDGSFEVKGLGRFRFNIYRSSSGIGAVLRVISQKVPTIDELHLSPGIRSIAEATRGLVLVTGATGSGKSSTLAAMIDHLNSTQALHIITIEDPIEYNHVSRKCRLSQREIGRDTKNFAVALKSALRQDPDIILVGEMRDHETLDTALKAAETGHLVFSTVHTSDAMKTIGRLVSLYPPEEQLNARVRLADNLHAIISQRMIPGAQSPRVVAQEILINNLGIAECILNERKTAGIHEFMEKGQVAGMQTFDQHLSLLLQSGAITAETAVENATNSTDFTRNHSFALPAGDSLDTPNLDIVADPSPKAVVPPPPPAEATRTNLKIPKPNRAA